MKRFITLLFCLILLCPLVTVRAATPKIIDDADLLLYGEVSLLEEEANRIAEEYGMDVVILTMDDFSRISASIEVFADNFYDNNGYGDNGVLLVLSMDTREWAISTCGDAIYAITDFGIQALFEDMAPYLSEDEYYEAFEAYLNALPYYFEAYENGSPIDGWAGNYDGPGSVVIGTREDVVYYEKDPPYLLAPVIGLVLAGIVILIMRSAMNTKRPQRSAAEYIVQGSYQLRRHQDIFLYSQVRKVRKQQQSSGGGGSSVHRSSGGRSHGGGRGRF